MQIDIHVPIGNLQPEKTYIAKVIFGEFLGLNFNVRQNNSNDWKIAIGQMEIRLPNLFFPSTGTLKGRVRELLPRTPVVSHSLESLKVPSGYTNEKRLPFFWKEKATMFELVDNGNDVFFPLDILGTAFLYLTRFEEWNSVEIDECDRFQLEASIAKKSNLNRLPVVDELVEVLYRLMQSRFPSLERRPRNFEIILSHDVDLPLSWVQPTTPKLLKKLSADIVKRKSISAFRGSLRSYFDPKHDPYNCFSWIMGVSEKFSLRSAFNFIAGGTHPFDNSYDLRRPFFRQLISEIESRGHEIGLHGSFDSFRSVEQLKTELTHLQSFARSPVRGGRQHYLRFDVPTTWKIWDSLGLEYDSSLGFAAEVGFRCGTSLPYTTFDLDNSKHLALVEKPLIVMEHSLFGYQKLSRDDAYVAVTTLVDKVKQHSGSFTLLWHNNNFIREEDRELYVQIIQYALS